ncbi:methyltransferase domain-containing protein [Actinoallomurus soli]|uniref:methyltransferase domain-containing protein n=1 Tax=Actinoallomurus soli TaxID=2952535 RepID=UPI0020931A2D|nr:methyltransferase domain-containing protein [Actinoallomurus soli]MCO5975073.1 methyltransferase domain-containing protein [Actinoallomurus soli]
MPVLEISDLIGAWDPATGARLPVGKDEVVARLRAAGDRRAVRIVERMPASGGFLDPEAVDRLFVRVHTELQRLGEEMRMAQRFAELLRPLVAAARRAGFGPLRIVDVGCGIGPVTRSLAASGTLGGDIELIGADLNPVLVAEATRLAEDEGLTCRFVRRDALALDEPATFYISSGVLHHLPAASLPGFFHAQDRPGTAGFVHYDIAATRLAPLGAWVFHRARMREPLGRHDGVASARRAHGDAVLLDAASSAEGMRVFLFTPPRHANPCCATMRPVIGVRPELAEGLRRGLGRRARGLTGAGGARGGGGGAPGGPGVIRGGVGGVGEGTGGGRGGGDVREGPGCVRRGAGGVREETGG